MVRGLNALRPPTHDELLPLEHSFDRIPSLIAHADLAVFLRVYLRAAAMAPEMKLRVLRLSYDVEHVCTAHPRMSREEWEAIYRESWSIYYTPKHMETLLRRAVATGVPVNSLIKVLVNFATTTRLENVHPLQGGIFRLKHPSERRPGLPRERSFAFWPRFVWETLGKHAVIISTIARLLALRF